MSSTRTMMTLGFFGGSAACTGAAPNNPPKIIAKRAGRGIFIEVLLQAGAAAHYPSNAWQAQEPQSESCFKPRLPTKNTRSAHCRKHRSPGPVDNDHHNSF